MHKPTSPCVRCMYKWSEKNGDAHSVTNINSGHAFKSERVLFKSLVYLSPPGNWELNSTQLNSTKTQLPGYKVIKEWSYHVVIFSLFWMWWCPALHWYQANIVLCICLLPLIRVFRFDEFSGFLLKIYLVRLFKMTKTYGSVVLFVRTLLSSPLGLVVFDTTNVSGCWQ